MSQVNVLEGVSVNTFARLEILKTHHLFGSKDN